MGRAFCSLSPWFLSCWRISIVKKLLGDKTVGYGTGRIGELIKHLKKTQGKDISDIEPGKKLFALCESLQMSHITFDRMISENSPVYRTVKGHAFESFFDALLIDNGFKVKEVGGDDAVVNRPGF